MPLTQWNDVPRGQLCELPNCTNYATHFYGGAWICCECHAGEDGNPLFTNTDAEKYHLNTEE